MPIEPRNASELIDFLGLEKHPEGGWYTQTFQDVGEGGQRALSTAIYYLLERGDRSHWHRVDAGEIWHFYTGSPLELSISPDGTRVSKNVLGADIAAGQRPQLIVTKGYWQSAISLGDWTLVGCTVAPGFQFSGFELAEPGWSPG